MQETPKLNRMQAIRTFFSKDSRPVETPELANLWKTLSEGEKQELSQACAKALGAEIA